MLWRMAKARNDVPCRSAGLEAIAGNQPLEALRGFRNAVPIVVPSCCERYKMLVRHAMASEERACIGYRMRCTLIDDCMGGQVFGLGHCDG